MPANGNTLIQLKSINFQDKDLQLIQDNVNQALVALQQSPFIGGNLLKSVVLSSSGNNAVAHGLQRVPTVWVLCGNNANSVVWATSQDTGFLNLSCSANCTVTLWVN